jgi:hypothetical protein
MFCPKCSQSQTSERVRFCSRCGLRLDGVKELVGREDERPAGGGKRDPFPPQREITTGALLMYAGALLAAFSGLFPDGPAVGVANIPAVHVLGFALAFVTLLFRPLSRALRKIFSDEEGPAAAPKGRLDGLNLGATLMFIGSLEALLITSTFTPDLRPSRFLLLLTVFLFLVLAVRPLLRAVYKLLRKDRRAEDAAPADEPPSLPDAAAAHALPSAQSVPAAAFNTARQKEPAPARPPSVTEGTTRHLGVPVERGQKNT